MSKKYLSRAAVLAAEDRKTAEVDVPEWGGVVRIRALNASEVEAIGFSITTPTGRMDVQSMEGVSTQVVAWACIDEEGKKLFNERDVEALGQKSFHAINRIAGEIMMLTGLAEKEEEVKNG